MTPDRSLDDIAPAGGDPREPRHVRLARHFSERVQSGELQPGDRLPSFNEMHERFGVGRDTLERMLSLLEKEGIVLRSARRGVFIADAGKPVRVGTVGFVTSQYAGEDPYYNQLLSGALDEARRAQIEILILFLEAPARYEKVDGILYPAPLLNDLRQPPTMPQVSLVYQHHNVSSVIADDHVGMCEAVEHLWSLGHRRIALLTSELQIHNISRRRLDAYRDVLLGKGVRPQDKWVRKLTNPGIIGIGFEDQGYLDMTQWLAEDWDEIGCSAILAQNDGTAVGVIRALEEAGHEVPGDISVVGFDGTDIARYHRPRLTTVRVPLREVGAAGLRLLMEQIARPIYELGEYEPRCVVLPTQFQPGESTTSPKNRVTNSRSNLQ